MKKEYEITTALLGPNIYSRPGSKMLGIRGVAIHWVGNPKSTAMGNRNYFDRLKSQTTTPRRYASAHEVIGLDGEVVICLPKNEVGFHVGAKIYKPKVKTLLANSPNRYLYGIETCHPDWNGKFNDKTYHTVINRVSDLLIEFNLIPNKDTIWRHYDVTGKDCPKYYINNPKEWDKLIADITKRYNEKVEVLFVAELLEWQKEMGNKSLDSLSKKTDYSGKLIVNTPDTWKVSLAEDTPQWLFWSIVDRITK